MRVGWLVGWFVPFGKKGENDEDEDEDWVGRGYLRIWSMEKCGKLRWYHPFLCWLCAYVEVLVEHFHKRISLSLSLSLLLGTPLPP